MSLPHDARTAFWNRAIDAQSSGDAGPSPANLHSEAEAALGRFLADGSRLDLFRLAGLLAGLGHREAEAYEAISRFAQSIAEFVPDGDSVAPGEQAYDVYASQSPEPDGADGAAAPPQIGEDLSDQVTVFVTTIGYPTFERCMDCLRAQDCRFPLKVIENVAPMSAAFQRMLDECETPFYVQVDEDMLLYPQAVRTLYERIRTLDDNVAMFAACLFDEHMDRAIYGIKIFRTDIVRRYPMRDVEGFELEQRSRWRRDGYTDVFERIEGAGRHAPRTLGLHGTHWTPLAIYVRYLVLELTRRKGTKSHQWIPQEARKLLARFLAHRTEVDLYALGGILAGRLQDRLSTGRSKHFGRYRQTPGFDHFQRFVETL